MWLGGEAEQGGRYLNNYGANALPRHVWPFLVGARAGRANGQHVSQIVRDQVVYAQQRVTASPVELMPANSKQPCIFRNTNC